MKVNGIMAQNYKMSFGGIYSYPGANKDDEAIAGIVKTLRTPQKEFNDQSAENFYKSKYDIDFYVDKYGEKTVCLNAYTGVKPAGTGINESITYKSSFNIGIYDKEHPLKISDIEFKRNEKRKKDIGHVALMSLLLVGMIGFLVAECTRGHNKTNELTKPLIETVDSTLNTKINLPLTK